MRRRVALKVIKLGMDTRNVVARFEAERQALAMMDHPHIAKVLDGGATENGRPYFVMELVRGIKITEYCDQNNLSTPERLDLFIKVCQAVQHAHQKGIIHRDLKPSNILVTLHDGVPVPKVIDFGIAKATEGRLSALTVYTELHQLIGTPAYMSPEQVEMSGLDVDTRSDIYSLGVLLNELLTGKTPFDTQELLALGLDAMRRTIREKEPVRPSTRLSTMLEGERTTTAKRRGAAAPKLIHLLRGDLDWIVMKTLEKDRTRRYETANGLARDLQRYLTNEPVVARPPSAAYRVRKFVRRNKVIVTAATVVATALVLGITVSMFEAIRATRLRKQADTNAHQARQAQARESEQRQAAEEARARAAKSEAESRERLVRLNVANGTRLMNEGDLPDALLWFGQALSLVQGDPVQERFHRLRCASVLQHCPKLLQVLEHKGWIGMEYAEFSPDGRRILTTGSDGTAQVWDAATGEPITPPLQHSSRVVHGLFSPDGHRVVTASFDNTARVWNADTGEPITPPLKHSNWVYHAEFSPDGRHVVTAGRDNRAQVWDATTGEPSLAPLMHTNRVFWASFSSDGGRVVTASADNTARVWDAMTGVALTPPLQHEGAVLSAIFSPDARSVLTASSDGTARLWDAGTGRPLGSRMEHDRRVELASISPNGQQVLTLTEESVRVWDPTTGAYMTLNARPFPVVQMDARYPLFSPDGRLIIAPFGEQSARVYDAVTGQPITPPLPHNGTVFHAAFGPDSHHVVTASQDGTARAWELRPEEMRARSSRPGSVVNRVSSSPDGHRIVLACGDGAARILDATSGRPLGSPLQHAQTVVYACFSPDGTYVVTASKDGTARVWDGTTGQALTPPLEHDGAGPFTDVSFRSDSRRFTTACLNENNENLRVWDARTGQLVMPPINPSGLVEQVAFSPDGRWIATACFDKTARVWDAETGQARTPHLLHGQAVIHVAFSPDSRLLLTGSCDGTARVWDAATGEPVIVPLQHDQPVLGAEFNADATRVLTATQDGAWAWELSSDDRPVEDVVLEGNILAGRQIDNSGSLMPLARGTIRAGCQQLRSKYPSQRQPDTRGGFTPVELAPLDNEVKQFLAKLRFTRRPSPGASQRKPDCVNLSTVFNAELDLVGLSALPTG
jgi:eukaryotic-like serine/threonine-protein kinase